MTNCPNPECKSTSFELASNVKVKNCNHQIHFIQCSECKTAITAFSNRQDVILEELAKQIGVR